MRFGRASWRSGTRSCLRHPLVYAVQPLLDQITSMLHESSSMAVLESDEILYLARSSTTTRLLSIELGIGSRLPCLLHLDGPGAPGGALCRRAGAPICHA